MVTCSVKGGNSAVVTYFNYVRNFTKNDLLFRYPIPRDVPSGESSTRRGWG